MHCALLNQLQVQSMCIIGLICKLIVKVFLRLHPQREKLLLRYKELESAKHTPQCVKQRKRRTRNLFRFCSTKPVIFKPVIGDSNVGGLTPKLVVSILT
jgi:hypothetical protein